MEARRVKTRRQPGLQRSRQAGPQGDAPRTTGSASPTSGCSERCQEDRCRCSLYAKVPIERAALAIRCKNISLGCFFGGRAMGEDKRKKMLGASAVWRGQLLRRLRALVSTPPRQASSMIHSSSLRNVGIVDFSSCTRNGLSTANAPQTTTPMCARSWRSLPRSFRRGWTVINGLARASL